MLVILYLKTWLEIISTVATLVVATIQGVNQAQGMYQTSKGYISSQGMYIGCVALAVPLKYGFSGR